MKETLHCPGILGQGQVFVIGSVQKKCKLFSDEVISF